MDKQAIIEKVKARLGADGKITCEQAMKLADAEGVSTGTWATFSMSSRSR